MPAWFFAAVWFLIGEIIQKGLEKFNNIMNAYDLITDRLSDCAFSLFIMHDSGFPMLKERFVEAYRYWIEAAITACPAHLFMMFNYHIIKADDKIREFIESSDYLSKVWKKVKEAVESQNYAEDLPDLIKYILEFSWFRFMLNAFESLIMQPIRIVDEICSHLLTQINQNPQDEITALKQFLSKMATQETGEIKITLDEELLLRLNPFLHFLSPTILAHIRMWFVYGRIEEKPRLIIPPKEYLQALFADIYVDNEHIASVNPDDDLVILFTMPPKPEWLQPSEHEAVLNYAGIIRKAKFSIVPPLKLTVTARGRQGYMACNMQGDISVGIDPQGWEGEFWINCNTYYGDSYSFAWIEFEHNFGDRPFWITFLAGAYREACYGETKVYVGYRENDTLYLTEVGEIPYTMLNPGWITLEGSFPSPRFVVGFYHYCYDYPLSVTGVRVKHIEYGWSP